MSDDPQVDRLKQSIMDKLHHVQAKFPEVATPHDWYMAVAYAVREHVMEAVIHTSQTYFERTSRTACYLSAEFLLGPQLANNLHNLGLVSPARQALQELGWNLDDILAVEDEPALGNGGLGRLAACFMDSLATMQIPAIGYGIRYEFGIFKQAIRDGWQVEFTDKWLRFGNPWEIPRPEIAFPVGFGGTTRGYWGPDGRYRVQWTPERQVFGQAYDVPVIGYRVGTANFLRLWQAQAAESFDFQAFNQGDYYGSVQEKVTSENITKVLYPNDEPLQGKYLRLQQQYFFVSCALQDMIRIFRQRVTDMSRLHEKYAVQLNDTHPAIAVVELMRLLIDEHDMDWEPAWGLTCRIFSYTNHTLLPEALECWPLEIFGSLLPRHLELIYEINRRFLDEVRVRRPGDLGLVRRVSLINESGDRSVRMAHLACVGSHAVNGVAEVHSQLLRERVLADFHFLYPDRFCNVTNGVTPRRFIAQSNPRLAALIDQTIGDRWLTDLEQLRRLEPLADDASFQEQWRAIKRDCKSDLAVAISKRLGATIDPDSLFDIHAKRIHEYKRQHLNVLHIIDLYLRLKDEPQTNFAPRTFLFAGKAAPGYFMAKLIIKLIHDVAAVIQRDPQVRDRLRVVFVPDFNVQWGQHIYPAADVSEQISTAGTEASGTGNMKFALNGAVTIGTLDGANIEIRSEVGEENFFHFGMTVEEVSRLKSRGYAPYDFVCADAALSRVVSEVAEGRFSNGDRQRYKPLLESLLNHDPFLVLADFAAYRDCQRKLASAFADNSAWDRRSILNVARCGRFSSDRSIREYCERIWRIQAVQPADTTTATRKT